MKGLVFAAGLASTSACSSDNGTGAPANTSDGAVSTGGSTSSGSGGASSGGKSSGGSSSGGGASGGGASGGGASGGGASGGGATGAGGSTNDAGTGGRTGSGGSTSDAGRDANVAAGGASTDSGAPDAATSGCGNGVDLKNGHVRLEPAQSNPGAGIVVTSSTCVGNATLGTTDAGGHWGPASVVADAPYYLKASGGAFYTGLTGEFEYPNGTTNSGVDAQLFDDGFAQYYPDHDSSHAEIEVHISPGQPSTACAGIPTGYVLTVPGHSEAHITYWGNSGLDASLTSTVNGIIYVSLITPGTPVAITATNGTCTVNFALAGQTGRAPLEAGAITYIIGAPQP